MNKKLLISIWFMLMVLIGVTVTYASLSYFEDDSLTLIDKRYYIKALDESETKVLYEIDVDEVGMFIVKEKNLEGSVAEGAQASEYENKFTQEEFESFKKVILNLNNMYSLNGNNHLFYYDYSANEDIAKNDKDTILKFAKSISAFAKEEATGKEWFDAIVNELGSSNGKYKEIRFTEKKIKSETINLGDRQTDVQVIDKKVFIDGVDANMENSFDEIYVTDVDGDGIVEFITRTYDLRISPPTNYYYIYKVNTNNTVTEKLKISIMGSIDTFYVDGNKLMIKYVPFEAKPGYIEVGNYTLK